MVSSRATTGSSLDATTERRSGSDSSAMSALAASARSSHSATRSLGQQLLGHLDQTGGGDLFFALGLQARVLLLHGLANGGDATLQGALGDGALGLGQVGQHGGAVLAAGLEPLRLRPLGQLWRGSEAGPGPAIAALATGGIGDRRGPGGRRRGAGGGRRRRPGPSARGRPTIAVGTRRGGDRRRGGGRSPSVRRGGRSRRSPRSPRSPRPPPRPASCWVTASNGFALGRISSSPDFSALPLIGAMLRTVVPSSSASTSARRTSPTFGSPERIDPARTPLGTRAPAARQVHVPSGRALVNSISILRDIRCHAIR